MQESPISDAFFAVPVSFVKQHSPNHSPETDDTIHKSNSVTSPQPPRSLSLIIAGNVVTPVDLDNVVTSGMITSMMNSLAPNIAQDSQSSSLIQATIFSPENSSYESTPNQSSAPSPVANEDPQQEPGFWLINKIIGFSKHFQPFNADGSVPAAQDGTETKGIAAIHNLKRSALSTKARWSADNIAVSQSTPPASHRAPLKSILKKPVPRSALQQVMVNTGTASQDSVNESQMSINDDEDVISSDTSMPAAPQIDLPVGMDQKIMFMGKLQPKSSLYSAAYHSSAPDLTTLTVDSPQMSRLNSQSSLSSSKKKLMFSDDNLPAGTPKVYLATHSKTAYNRKPDANMTLKKLTPQLKMEIREELNAYKRSEMQVHEESVRNTAFH